MRLLVERELLHRIEPASELRGDSSSTSPPPGIGEICLDKPILGGGTLEWSTKFSGGRVAGRHNNSSDGATTCGRILDASRRLFNERGYVGTTTAAIAAEVRITEGNLWYHFRTKLDLVRDAALFRRSGPVR